MARPKKITDDIMMEIVYKYYQEKCIGNPSMLKYSKIAEYAQSNGCDIAEYDLRRTLCVKEYINKIKNDTVQQLDIMVPIYKAMNVSDFLNLHTNKTSLKKALIELDEYWKRVYNSLVIIKSKYEDVFSRNKQLSELNQKLKSENQEITEKIKNAEQIENSLVKENRYLKSMLQKYLYDSLAARIIDENNLNCNSMVKKSVTELSESDGIPKSFTESISSDVLIKTDIENLMDKLRRNCDE